MFIMFAPVPRAIQMLRILVILLFILFLSTGSCYSQETDPGPGYQMVLMNNPALSGSEGDGVLRLSYLNFYPGNGYNLHSVYFSFDSYFQALHGGTSVYLAEDYLGGAVNDIRGGFSYAYFMQAGEDLFINAGLTASLYHQGYNFSNSILPDQIDQLGGITLPSGETLTSSGRTLFDLGTGFVFIKGIFSGGVSVLHLAEPEFSTNGPAKEKIGRKLFLHLCGEIPLRKSQSINLRPVAYMSYQGDFLTAGGGVAAENKHLAVNLITMGDNAGNLNLQTGFSFQKGIVRVFYNYRFNIVSNNVLLPLSLLHQTGLSFSLYNVDKRKAVKTINFPKL